MENLKAKPNSNEQDEQHKQLIEAFKSTTTPKIYSNGFVCGNTLADAFIMFQVNGEPAAVVNLPIPIVKGLISDLHTMITKYETDIELEFPSISDLKKRVEKKK